MTMTTIDRSQLIEQILQQRRAFKAPVAPLRTLPAVVDQPQRSFDFTDKPQTSRASETVMQGLAAAQPRLVNESLDTLDRGFRRTQVFRQSDGRNFIRNEEVTLTDRGLSRVVSQENPSGSRVRFEENLQRQPDGTFQRTVRYTDETGAVETKVDERQSGIDPFIASGGALPPGASNTASRGSYYDLTV